MMRIVFNPNSYFVQKHRDNETQSLCHINNDMQYYIELKIGNDILKPEDLLDVMFIQAMGKELEHALFLLGKNLKIGDRQTQYFFGQDVFTILSDYISSVAHVESR